MENIIIKFNGEKAPRSKCRRLRRGKLKPEFYERNIDCFRIDGVWRRCDDKYIYKNLDRKDEYVRKSYFDDHIKNNSRGLKIYTIGVNAEGDDIMGYSTGIPFNIVEVYNEDTGEIERHRTSEFDSSNYSRNEKNGIYYKRGHASNISGQSGMLYRREIYNFDKIMGFYRDAKFSFNPIRKSKYSFGVEIETENGKIPVSELTSLGLFPLRDGSIGGFEYTSVPFNDLGHAVDIAKAVSKYCQISTANSLHVHIGGLNTDKDSIVTMYEVLYNLQDEIYSMFPAYKQGRNDVKRQAYSDRLPRLSRDSVDSYFNELMQFFTNGNMNGESYKGKRLNHPQDPNGEHKWQIGARYRIFNLVPMIFSEGRTVESRIHEETTNPYKIAYWIMINEAIVDYAQKRTFKQVFGKKITLDLILNEYFGKKEVSALTTYIDERKKLYATIGVNDIETYLKISSEDKSYEPPIKLF